MDKRYQVFVSSTFADLKEERQRVTQTLMEMDCIPAGMELFPAADEEQWTFIKRIIADCDYYILIIGGRYGSLTPDGISYTEKEYEYAISIGLKVLAFVHESPEELPEKKLDIEPELREKLDSFRDKVTSNRLVKFWTTPAELPGIVALSLAKTIKLYPAVGWIRAQNIASDEVLADLNVLRKTNDSLRDKLRRLEQLNAPPDLALATLDENFELTISWETLGRYASKYQESVTSTWAELFAIIGPSLIEHPNNKNVSTMLADALYRKHTDKSESPYNVSIVKHDLETIRLQLTTHGLLKAEYKKSTNGGMSLFWMITPKGQNHLLKLRTVKTSR